MLKRLRAKHPIGFCVLSEVLFLGSLLLASYLIVFALVLFGVDLERVDSYFLSAVQEAVGMVVALVILGLSLIHILNAETPALEKALHRAGVDANPFTVAARQADLLVVEDPAWAEMPAQLPGQVLLVFTGSNVAEGWAEALARRGYYRDFRWRSRGRAQQSALYCTVQPLSLIHI